MLSPSASHTFLHLPLLFSPLFVGPTTAPGETTSEGSSRRQKQPPGSSPNKQSAPAIMLSASSQCCSLRSPFFEKQQNVQLRLQREAKQILLRRELWSTSSYAKIFSISGAPFFFSSKDELQIPANTSKLLSLVRRILTDPSR
nr:uncharacterized protein LOC104645641 [Solanum lycopersicum]